MTAPAARGPMMGVNWPAGAGNFTRCIAERLLVLCGECVERPASGYANAVEAALADPFEREGLSPAALAAIEYVEGCADAEDCTVLELLEELEIKIQRAVFR